MRKGKTKTNINEKKKNSDSGTSGVVFANP